VILKNWTFGLAIGLLGIVAPTLGHHSFGMFDLARTEILEGTVREFQWTNPHVVIWIDSIPEEGGDPETWAVELTSPGNLQRAGWSKRTFNPGDRVSITMSPLRSGNNGGAFRAMENFTTGESLEYDYTRLGQVQ
jgi:hypothetical protein